MHLSISRFILYVQILCFPFYGLANHQVGGQLEMRAIGDVPGHYRVIVTNYLEVGPTAKRLQGGKLGIFRKKDNALMLVFNAKRTGPDVPIVFSNKFCASLRNLNFIAVNFEAEIQLDPSEYSDKQGYYLSYQGHSRNTAISNIRRPVSTGFTYYLEFPALQEAGKPVTYSSPHFPPINGEYICQNEPFTFAFGATDPDGDQLRYSLVTPLDQKIHTEAISPGPYPRINWRTGYGTNNAIPGRPALSINSQTGMLSVTASQTGLFLFGVNVEKYRAGRKIGEVRRDFQFLVVDCSPKTVPKPSVRANNKPLTLQQITICPNDSLQLQTTRNSAWNYQWRRNGGNIPGANQSSLTVREAGDYSVVVSSKNECLQPSVSQNFVIKSAAMKSQIEASGPLCGIDGIVRLRASAQSDIGYQWYRNGKLLANQTTDSVLVTQEGRYSAVLTHLTLGCVYKTDTLTLTRLPITPATIRPAKDLHRLCPDDSLLLESSAGNRYTWQRDKALIPGADSPTYTVKAAGRYVVSTTDEDGCLHISEPFIVEAIPPITVLFDSIPPACDSSTAPIQLKGNPAGGVFAGYGVTGTLFNPQRAGFGRHPLTYTVKAVPECAGTVATRIAAVGRPPSIELPDSIITYKGSTVPLSPTVSSNAVSFQWSPGTYLTNPLSATTSAVAITDDITYTFSAASKEGCAATKTVAIDVFSQIWVPDAFTPNGDGLNDVLALPGIEAFPDAVITIFNRWGEVIYQSAKGYPLPFDGTLNGNELPTGIYSYVLRTGTGIPPTKGNILLLRN